MKIVQHRVRRMGHDGAWMDPTSFTRAMIPRTDRILTDSVVKLNDALEKEQEDKRYYRFAFYAVVVAFFISLAIR